MKESKKEGGKRRKKRAEGGRKTKEKIKKKPNPATTNLVKSGNEKKGNCLCQELATD